MRSALAHILLSTVAATTAVADRSATVVLSFESRQDLPLVTPKPAASFDVTAVGATHGDAALRATFPKYTPQRSAWPAISFKPGDLTDWSNYRTFAVDITNPPAIRTYAALGFERIGDYRILLLKDQTEHSRNG